MTTAPKRDARAVLAIGGLLLVPLAALWLLLAPVRGPHHGGGQAPAPGEGQGAGTGGPGTPGGMGTSILPAAPSRTPSRVASGAPVQADWTLLALTFAPRNGLQTLPASLAADGRAPAAAARNPFLQVSAGAVGLWIGVRGGTGIKTLNIPQDGSRHTYPFGRFSLVSLPQPSSGVGGVVRTLLQWQETDAGSPPGRGSGRTGQTPSQGSRITSQTTSQGSQTTFQDGEVSSSEVPYRMSSSMTLATPGHPALLTVTLTPLPFSARFRITALPLSARGRPTGKAVHLLCQPVMATALFTQIPTGYSAATHQFRVSVTRAGGRKGNGASWLITDLPPAVEAGAGGAPAAASARVGPFTLRAVAAEAEDTSGEADPANVRPTRPSGPYSQNIDQHSWTGLPTIRYLLLARAAAPPPGQSWLFQLDRVTPQWGMPPPAPGPPGTTYAAGPLGLFPLSRGLFRPDPTEWVLQDGEVGAAWPGQQHWVTLAGTAIRQASRTETVTFHDAEVVWDAGFGGDRIVWHHPETETTPSGIAVTVLNGRVGKRDTTAPTSPGQFFGQPSGQEWWYDRGNAELLLAWRLPPGFLPGQHAALSIPRVALPPEGAAPPGGGRLRTGVLAASWDSTRPAPYIRAVSLPGAATDARPLARDGYDLLRLSVWAAQTPTRTPLLPLPPLLFSPPVYPPRHPFVPGHPFVPRRMPPPAPLPRYCWRDGPFVVKATPLPRHLAAITLHITIREEQERRPVRLVVPVSATLPPGGGRTAVPQGVL